MDLGLRAPLARSKDLIIEELGEELLVYDTETDRAHCLSREAAVVWRRCDGRTPAEGLRMQLNMDAETVARALAELEACELLEAPLEPTLDVVHSSGTTRREAATKAVKVGTGLAVGSLILSQAAPAGAQAVSPAFCAGIQTNDCGTCEQNDCCCCTPGTNNPAATQTCAATFDLCCAQTPPAGVGPAGTNVSNCSEAGGNGPCPTPA